MSQKEQLREKFARGVESLAQADFPSAIEIFEEVLKADPKSCACVVAARSLLS